MYKKRFNKMNILIKNASTSHTLLPLEGVGGLFLFCAAKIRTYLIESRKTDSFFRLFLAKYN